MAVAARQGDDRGRGQGNYFLFPTVDGVEKISIEEFRVAIVAGQLVMLVSVNPWFTIPN